MNAAADTTRTWKITLLSPMHLGDGNKLIVNLDFLVQNGRVDVIDFNSLAEQLAETPKAINDLSRDVRLDRIVQEYGVAVRPMYTMKCGGSAKPKEIRSFLKNAYGQPYLAGSSLKGAIHTALWTGLNPTEMSPRANNKEDYKSRFRRPVEKLGGDDPYHVFIRPLQISDSTGLIAQGNLVCEEIKFFNLKQGDQPGWRAVSSQQTQSDFRQAVGMYVETLQMGAEVVVQAHIDPLLAKDAVRRAAGIKRSEDVSGFDRMIGRIRAHYRRIAEREREFFDRYGAATKDVVRFYDGLLRRMRDTEGKPGAFVLRMSWGSGWRGMTGDWIKDEDMAYIREREFEKLGKPGVKVFPKTRRLAIDPKTGTPSLPLGWVLVEPVESEAFRLRSLSKPENAVETSSAIPAKQPTGAAQPTPPVEATDPQALRKERLDRFRRRIQGVRAFQGEADQLIKAVQQENDPEVRKEMTTMLLEKARSLSNNAYSRALNERKTWAVSLHRLVEEMG